MIPCDLVDVSYTHVVNLLKHYWSNTYVTMNHSETDEDILNLVELLWAMDYNCMEICNEKGKLCPNYPRRIYVPDAQLETKLVVKANLFQEQYDDQLKVCVPKMIRTSIFRDEYKVLGESFTGYRNKSQEYAKLAIQQSYQSIRCVSPLHSYKPSDGREYFASLEQKRGKLQALMNATHLARSRHRVVVPVMLYNGVYVARSATIALNGEFYFRKTVNSICSIANKMTLLPFYEILQSDLKDQEMKDEIKRDLSGIEEARSNDVALLEHLKISTIFDLMVEAQKVCYGLYTASSEKATKGEENYHYKNLSINQVPYPGCEFFKNFGQELHSENLIFNWEDGSVNSRFMLESAHLKEYQVANYRSWSLDYLTKHYLMIMLTHLKRGDDLDGGLLVHCISGWDRTPLFVSLLRISLWADGEIHRKFSPIQMLYFTLAYDWMFFCHDMKKRTGREELILFFCFYFLKFIKGENFNTTSSDHFGKNIETEQYEGEFVMINDSDLDQPSSADTSSDELVFNVSKSPEVPRTAPPNESTAANVVAGVTAAVTDYIKSFSDEANISPVKKEDTKSLSAKLDGRGMSSPTVPGSYMPETVLSDEERKRANRYKQITSLRRIFFSAFKQSLPNVQGLGVMETDFET